MTRPLTKQLKIYLYIQAGHTQKDACKAFGCSESYVSRCIKTEAPRHGEPWIDKRRYTTPVKETN